MWDAIAKRSVGIAVWGVGSAIAFGNVGSAIAKRSAGIAVWGCGGSAIAFVDVGYAIAV